MWLAGLGLPLSLPCLWTQVGWPDQPGFIPRDSLGVVGELSLVLQAGAGKLWVLGVPYRTVEDGGGFRSGK